MKRIFWILTVTMVFSILPASAVEQGINISGTWILDREESVINSASGLMEREDFARRAPQEIGIPGRKSSPEAIPGDRPGPGTISGKRPEGNFPGRSNWQDLELTLIITQSQEELEIIHRYTYEYEDKHITQAFSLDGGQDYNVMRSGPGKYLSETTVEKDRIINQGMHEVSTHTGDRAAILREEYSLSDKGETLILRANHSTPKGEISSTMVFHRVAEASE